ncbi:PKD_channel domain-containing protein [Caenorhabditis elegans]|uniref:PKD_channel domain-containing protein n=1 Tax=Caenorhabditis elegans TaxID=6239 RepID=Q9XVZ7_CAEEL|nr:PKD_channel domain-containing protein [Caenorhabditis elegans]CAA22455.2 PKD_channel domain-containing protein [Caenorhabditis elegans]|eukprot:NP_496972.2 Uncharacterized protein CELE_Y54G11A.1 [Caenorhabditis elegans]
MRMPRRRTNLLILIITFLIFTDTVSTSSDPCLDSQIEDPSQLHLPSQYANLTPPWQRADGKLAKVSRSEGLTYHWSWMKSLQVKGLSKTVEDIIGFLTDNQCIFVPVGPFVRSVILGKKTVYVSGEVSCQLHQLYDKCVLKFGAAGCSLYPLEDDGGWGAYRMEIGDASSNRSTFTARAEPIVIYEWRSVLGAPLDKWRFTVDTLAMFDDGAGDLFLIDPTGNGYLDVCEKKIAPTAENWDKWGKNQQMKLMGFYDLRSDGFAPKNETLQKFINVKIKSSSDKRVAQQFYCEHVLKGVSNLEGTTPVCHTMYPEKEAARKIGQMRTIMIDEMGTSWNSSIGKAADDLEAVFCTARQYVQIRSRLLHRVPSSNDEKAAVEDPPKLIQNGKPMINDSAQVHARPILNMAAKLPELPVEYPSVPRAQPNEKLEFVEPPELGAGAQDPRAIEILGSRDHPDPWDEVEHQEDREAQEDQETKRTLGGAPAEEEAADFSHHNAVQTNNLPVMRFDKVEEEEVEQISSAMEMSTENAASNWNIYGFLMIFCVFYCLLD